MNHLDCIILHGCPPDPNNIIPHKKRWMNWLAGELEKKGLHAIAPDMPTPWQPQYDVWKQVFDAYPITEKTILIGHSCSCAFLVRWLLDTKKTVRKLILVAPGKITERKEGFPLYDFLLPDDASSVAHERVIFISNDESNILRSVELYKKSLRPRIVHLENMGHFHIYAMETVEFPELFAEVVG